MITTTSAQLWSKNLNAVVAWSVALETETDEDKAQGEVYSRQVIVARHDGDEPFKFSPSMTDEELNRAIIATNKSFGVKYQEVIA